ncbi:MAG: hypothetical protein JXB05_31225 [Myxococcaceae bacterium]|nr:hypothetical protein [Myxococcaceae bacterium]
MLALVTALVLAAEPSGVRWERVDVLSEDPGLWLHQELPRLGVDALTPTVRFLTQVKGVWSTPVRGLDFGVSLGSQSLVYEYPLLPRANLALSLGLQTRLLLPRGALVGVAWRAGPVRLGLGLSVFSEATWSRVDYSYWTALPTLGLGFGRSPEPRAP